MNGYDNRIAMIHVRLLFDTYFFCIIHITRQLPDKLIYGILINSEHYYISKALGTDDCLQLDSQVPLERDLLDEICSILTRLEKRYLDYPELELVNLEIVKALAFNRRAHHQHKAAPAIFSF